jgi:Mg2+ and Co2+ transporter CorA
MKIRFIIMASLLIFAVYLGFAQTEHPIHPIYKTWLAPGWIEEAPVKQVLEAYKDELSDLDDQVYKLEDASSDNADLSGPVTNLILDSMELKKSIATLSRKIEDLESQIKDLSNRLKALEARPSP